MSAKALWLLSAPGVGQLVIRAPCESCARSQAAIAAGPEGPMTWRDSNLSTCKRISPDGVSGVVCDGRKG